MKIRSSRNGEITFNIDEGKSCHSRDFYIANMSFNAIRENKILAKISELTGTCSNNMSPLQRDAKLIAMDPLHNIVSTGNYPISCYMVFFKDTENLAIILVPLIMILSRCHTGQIKG